MDPLAKETEDSYNTPHVMNVNSNTPVENSSSLHDNMVMKTNSDNNQNFSDKFTPLMNLDRGFNEFESELPSSNDSTFRRQHTFNNKDMELSLEDFDTNEDDNEDNDDNEDREQMEIQHDGDYGDIQFFHHKLLLQQHLGHNEFGMGSGVSSFGSSNGVVNMHGSGVDTFHIEECDDNGIDNNFSENPFVFPDNVMEYGEPQFFPGNCVGYLETILEETDEEFEEEEGSSGRHWWTADSDTDTDSVIRVEQNRHSQHCNNNNQSTVQSATLTAAGTGGTNLKSVENVEDLSVQSTFRSSASSRPFELEDLHLLDQLDLAFEETLMEPRRRSGFAAFSHQLHLLDQPLETKYLQPDDERRSTFKDRGTLQRSASHDGERTVFSCDDLIIPQFKEKEILSYGSGKCDVHHKDEGSRALDKAESKETFGSSLSPSSSDSEPHEVAEEDFFYSSAGSESEEGSSSDDSDKNGTGVVLAEFSLAQTVNGSAGPNNSFTSGQFGSAKNRRSLESPLASSRLKSFRSFDSLNSLSGTELLFSKADTFPAFHYIKEDVEPGSSGSGSPSSPRCNLTSCSTSDVPGASTGRETTGGEAESQSLPSHHSVVGFPPTFNKITKKTSYSSSTSTASSSNSTSGMMSTENLSEDSGIGPEGAVSHPHLGEKQRSESFSEADQQEGESAKNYIAKSEFALNPLVFSSLSSSDAGSNNPSINSVPSLNNHDSTSADFSGSELKRNQGSIMVVELRENGESPSSFHSTSHSNRCSNDDTKAISRNSLSNFHRGKVDESDSIQIETPQSHSEQSNNKAESEVKAIPSISAIPLEGELPICINDQQTERTFSASAWSDCSTNNVKHCSPIRSEECGLHPYPDVNARTQAEPHTNGADKADSAKSSLSSVTTEVSDTVPDNPDRPTNERDLTKSLEKIYTETDTSSNVPLNSDSLLPSSLALSSPCIEKKEQCQQNAKQSHPDLAPSKDYLAQETRTSNYNDNDHPSVTLASILPPDLNQSKYHVGVDCEVPYPNEGEVGTQDGAIMEEEWVIDAKPLSSSEAVSSLASATSSTSRSHDSKHRNPSSDQLRHVNANVNSGDSYHMSHSDGFEVCETKQKPKSNITPCTRERSNSESEFEFAESAVELDSIALAFAIVNSPTTGSASSSPTAGLNGPNPSGVDCNVNSDGESGPMSTLASEPKQHHHQKKYVDVENVDIRNTSYEHGRRVFASPSALPSPCVAAAGQTHASGGGVNANNTNGNNSIGSAIESGIKNAEISLHHHHLHQKGNHVISQVREEQLSHHPFDPMITLSHPQSQCEPVGQEYNGMKPSRPVYPDKSSSADVVHHLHHQSYERAPRYNSNKSECGVDKLKHQVDYIGREEDELVVAKPIDPVHIGVAEVKKFTQLDSSVSRKSHYYQALGESESENIRLGPGSSSKAEEAILGHSNFGFFGRPSNTASNSVSKRVAPLSVGNLDPKSVSSSGKSTATPCASTESSELSSYGFPSPCSYPISDPNLHLYAEGGNETEIPEASRRNRDQLRDQHRGYLHLEDIKCGIHPENFTVPFGVYSAAVLAVAPAIPSKRLVFLNEYDQYIGLHEEPSKGNIPSSSTTTSRSAIASKKKQANPTNGAGVSTNSSSTVPDILVVKKTQFQGSDGDKEVIHTSAYSAMEVDTNAPSGGGDRRSTSPSGIPVKTRTYGPRNEVEVILVSSRTPSPAPIPGGSFPYSSSLKQHHPSTSSSLGEDGNNDEQNHTSTGTCPDPPAKVPRTRVHFSPVVSEISWRESYIDQSSEFSGSMEDISAKFTEVNPGDICGSNIGATIPTGSDNGGLSGYQSIGTDSSLVRPLQFSTDIERNNMSLQNQTGERQQSPGKGAILVEKVQMRSSFLQGGDDDEEEDELERKLTMNVHITDHRTKSPVDEDSNFDGDSIVDDPRKEGMEFRLGSGASNKKLAVDNDSSNEVLDFYEDVNVEINQKPGSTTLSMVPDLLSQCENASNAQTHIDVCIEEVNSSHSNKPPIRPKPLRKSHSPTPQPVYSSEIPPPPMNMNMQHQNQQQIFPKIFAEDLNGSGTFGKLGSNKSDSKNNSSSSLNKGKKSKSFGSASKKSGENTKERDNKGTNHKDKETETSKDEKAKGSKPGFFERLSKIRLSGSKPKKQKVHPKADELDQNKGIQPGKTQNAVTFNGSSSNGNKSAKAKLPSQPILKKSSGNSHTPVIPIYTPDLEDDAEDHPDKSSEAFENILEEIAGIKGIKMRMDKSSSNTSSPEKPSPSKETRSFAKRKQFYNTELSSPSPPVSPNGRSYSDLDKKLSQFKEETSKTRVVISKSHPDLELIEDMVRQQSASPDPAIATTDNEKFEVKSKSVEPKKSPKKSSMSETGQKNEREWYKLLKSAAEKYYYRGSSSNKDDSKGKPSSIFGAGAGSGIVETDLDTGASREMLDAELVELDKKVPLYTASTSEIRSATSSGPITTIAPSPCTAAKTRSLTNLSTRLPLSIAPCNYDNVDHLAQGELNDFDERAKSYEFLLDDNQKCSSVPPENQLRMESRKLSEHELRIQRSLQRLNVPEWFKKHEVTSRMSTPVDRPSSGSDADKPGNLTILSRRSEYGSAGGLAGGWAGLSAFKAPSMSSLQSSNGGRYSGSLNRSNFIRGRPATMSATRLSRESLTGTGSASHSPSAYDRCSFTYGMPFAMTRFGQGRLSNNSGTVTPTSTADSSISTTNAYVKKPYLGWRSQERLNSVSAASSTDGAPKLSIYLPPEERLAADLLRTRVLVKPPISDRPPLPKPPPRSEKTALTKTSSIDNENPNKTGASIKNSSNHPNNSIPPPQFSDEPQQSCRGARDRPPDVHDSIREVTKAISRYVAKGEDEAPKPQLRRKPGKAAIWIESSFVGRKPVNK